MPFERFGRRAVDQDNVVQRQAHVACNGPAVSRSILGDLDQ
jgi:hypothetical protein